MIRARGARGPRFESGQPHLFFIFTIFAFERCEKAPWVDKGMKDPYVGNPGNPISSLFLPSLLSNDVRKPLGLIRGRRTLMWAIRATPSLLYFYHLCFRTM